MNGFLIAATTAAAILTVNATAYAAACAFDGTQNCTLQRDILNDKDASGLHYYAPTNYDHRMSGEINTYNSSLVTPYTDSVNKPGQLRLGAVKINSGYWQAGEIMTDANLDRPPMNSPVKSSPWTTKEISHGYLEVVVKMPDCDTSGDSLCQQKSAPNGYRSGLWPAIWMMPTTTSQWPTDGEIDISEAYFQNSDFKTSTMTLHFNGNDSHCSWNDCVGNGYPLPSSVASTPLWNNFHTWGFEWQPDPQSTNKGQIITGYFDNVKVWGPLRTDTLPADGANALRRGFSNANGGYYLIVNLAMGGPYAGAPNAQLQTSSMYLQSAKAYTVGGITPPPANTCLPPANIQSMYSPDKKQVTLAWTAPVSTATIKNYQVFDWQKNSIWTGSGPNIRAFQDQTLPGASGTFTYWLATVCSDQTSALVQYNAVVTLKK